MLKEIRAQEKAVEEQGQNEAEETNEIVEAKPAPDGDEEVPDTPAGSKQTTLFGGDE